MSSIKNNNNTGRSTLLFANAGNQLGELQASPNGDIRLYYGNQSKHATFFSSGKVSIGDESPDALLTVRGNGDFFGNHIAFFENTGSDNADGIAIKLDRNVPNRENNFITFYDASNTVCGRIEGFNYNDDAAITLDDLENVDYVGPSIQLTPDFDQGTVSFDLTGLPTAQDLENEMCLYAHLGTDALVMYQNPITFAYAIAMSEAELYCRDHGVTFGSKGADYAEALEKEDPCAKYLPGTVVGVRNGKVSLCTYDAERVMVVSSRPVVLGNAPPEGAEDRFSKVGFMGQVRTFVIGPCRAGDLIVPTGDENGWAKAVAPEKASLEDLKYCIGKAWDDGKTPYLNFVNCAVGLESNDWIEVMKRQQQSTDQLQEQVNAMHADIELLKGLAGLKDTAAGSTTAATAEKEAVKR